MCGIVGYFGRRKDTSFIDNSLNEIIHRGGENRKEVIEEEYYLGFTRLAINDLNNAASSPFIKNGVILTCNGEIYNYKELACELKKYKMETTNDTEIIVNLYLEYNRNIKKVLDKIKGMFAICIVDKEKNRAYLIRDQIGIKPLYYCQIDENIYFSSEIKSFRDIGNYKFLPNYEQLFRILCYRSTSNENTVFRDIKKVAPACYIDIDLSTNNFSQIKYWTYPEYEPDTISPTEIKEKMGDIIEMHTLSDVDISTTLSGGLDSSIISAVVKKANRELKTFSSYYGVPGDETEKFEEVKNYLHVKNEKVLIPKEQFLSVLDELIWYMDEPFADPAVIPLYFISKAISKNNIKLTIMGEGADEVFLGYDKYREAYDNDNFNFINFIEKRAPFKMEQLEKMNPSLYAPFKKELDDIVVEYRFDVEKRKDVILNNLSRFDIEKMLPNLQLMRADKATMANTIEARIPFLYLDTISLVQSIRSTDEMSIDNEKQLLRDAFSDELPKDISQGKKQIFFVPLDFLVDDKNRKVMIDKIEKSSVVNKLILLDDKHSFFHQLNSYQIWILYMISIWEEKFIKVF